MAMAVERRLRRLTSQCCSTDTQGDVQLKIEDPTKPLEKPEDLDASRDRDMTDHVSSFLIRCFSQDWRGDANAFGITMLDILVYWRWPLSRAGTEAKRGTRRFSPGIDSH
jgi:hypothetical protein